MINFLNNFRYRNCRIFIFFIALLVLTTCGGNPWFPLSYDDDEKQKEKENTPTDIEKLNPTVTWPSGLTAIVGDTLESITIPANTGTAGAFSWTAGGSTLVGAEGQRTHNMTFTPSNTVTYNTVTHDVTIIVNAPGKINPTVTWPTSLTALVGQTLADITLPANTGTAGTFSWTETGTTSVGAAGAQTHNVTFTPTDISTYNIVTQNVTITVSAITYTVVYNPNGGSGNTASSTHTYGVSQNLTTNGFTNSGYDFLHWNTQENGLGTSYNNGASVINLSSTQGATVNLYAQWVKNIDSMISDIITIIQNSPNGGTTANPVVLDLDIPLGTMTSSDSGWQKLLEAIEAEGKYVDLDLSDCTMIDTTFNPVSSITTGKNLITSIVLPDTATSIISGTAALPSFNGFTELTYAEGSGITEIRIYAFRNCSNLINVDFPKLTNIGNYAFENCTNLAPTELPANLAYITSGAFRGCTNLALTELPAGIISIGSRAFQNCVNLALTTLPEWISSIESITFENCTNLVSIIIPANVMSIGEYAFAVCNNLESVTFERNDLTTIENVNAFPGDLVDASGGTGSENRFGTYTRTPPSTTWTKQ